MSATSSEEKIAVTRAFLDRVFNAHNPELALEFFSDDMTWRGGTLGTISGAENVVGLLKVFIGALPDLVATEHDVIASNDLVAVRLSVTATHSADLLGIPKTGNRVTWDAVDIYRVNDAGKITEEWAADDMAAFASQLGAFTLPWLA